MRHISTYGRLSKYLRTQLHGGAPVGEALQIAKAAVQNRGTPYTQNKVQELINACQHKSITEGEILVWDFIQANEEA